VSQMKKIRRSLVLLLLLIFSLVELRQGAIGAQPINVSASTTRSIYLIAKDSASPTHCVIVQMTENNDGTLSRASEYDGKLPGAPTGAFYCTSNGHLYVKLANGSKLNRMIAQFEFGKEGQVYPANPFILSCPGNGSLVANLSNRQVLSVDRLTCTIDLLSVDDSSGILRLKAEQNLKSGSTNKHDSRHDPNDPNDIVTGVIAVNSPECFFYVSESNFVDPTSDSILQFRVSSVGKILALEPPSVTTECGCLRGIDTVNRVLYSFMLYGDVRAFSLSPHGQLKVLSKEPSDRPEEYQVSPGGAGTDDNLIRIYPVPHAAPRVQLSDLTFDSLHKLLFGFGGTDGNEIFVWTTSSKGIGKLVKRYWCDQYGDLKETDPVASDNENTMVTPVLVAIATISSDGRHLYIFRYSLGPQFGTLSQVAVFSYKVSSSGELHKSSNKPCYGIDLSKLSLISPIVTYGTH